MDGCVGALVATAFVSVSMAIPLSAAPATRVVFTIDVESLDSFRLPDQIDTVCQDGTPCGVSEIARLLAARGWAGTFFLNVNEHRQWGETAMRDIAVKLKVPDRISACIPTRGGRMTPHA